MKLKERKKKKTDPGWSQDTSKDKSNEREEALCFPHPKKSALKSGYLT